MRFSESLWAAIWVLGASARRVKLDSRGGSDDKTVVVFSQAKDTPANALTQSSTTHSDCPPFDRGSFSIDAYQLYPENMYWDARFCQVYVGSVFR